VLAVGRAGAPPGDRAVDVNCGCHRHHGRHAAPNRLETNDILRACAVRSAAMTTTSFATQNAR
jgi:hypothetical protein